MNHETVKPCPWMRRALSALADGQLRGLWKWYVEAHERRCPRCGAAYRALLAVRRKLREAGAHDAANLTLGEERWKQIERACRSEDPPG
jgi:predicted anti-sigma-YlaC factor YlaD